MLVKKVILTIFILLNIVVQFHSTFFKANHYIKKITNKIKYSHSKVVDRSFKLWNNIISLTKNKNKPPYLVISPILLFILSISNVNASPLNKQYININGPFFQGWLIRNIDHANNLSFILIIGSFSQLNSNIYDEHYVFCGISSLNYNEHIEYFPPINTVTIKGNQPPPIIPSFNPKLLNITWNANGFGKFIFQEDYCYGDFNFNNKLRLIFNTTSRLSWLNSNITGNVDNNIYGPEGWLGFLTLLLPCHYYIHSVGSICKYSIIKSSVKNHIFNNTNIKNPDIMSKFFKLIQRTSLLSFFHNNNASNGNELVITGTGYAHIEGNYGSFFPEGWIWSQCISNDNLASFSLVLGKFNIAGMSPTNTILYIRRDKKKPIVIRTTDMDYVSYKVYPMDGTLSLNATSLLKNVKVEITIYPTTLHGYCNNITNNDIIKNEELNNDKKSPFGAIVHIPTAKGFSNNPGCRETYNAIATVRIWNTLSSVNDQNILEEPEEYIFPFTALEYGGSFINKLL